MHTHTKRKRKLIEPRLQGRFALLFAGMAAAGTLVQFVVVQFFLTRLAETLPNDGAVLLRSLPTILAMAGLVSLLILLPITFGLGVTTTFRLVGPLYRFRLFLKAVRDGEQSAPCQIREDDELQDFCELLNEVTEPLRTASEGTADADRAKAA